MKRKDFKEIGMKRSRFVGKALVIDFRSAQEAKLGLTVVRQFGCAVKRNGFKRRVREAFRINRSHLAPNEMVVMPKKGAEHFSFELISKDLSEFHAATQYSATKGC